MTATTTAPGLVTTLDTVLAAYPDRPHLAGLRAACREVAPELRALALAVDAAPLDVGPMLDTEALRLLRDVSVPPAFRDRTLPAWSDGYPGDCLARVVANLELARYGDAGVLAANTGPSLAGLAVDCLGDERQQHAFYAALAGGAVWTAFAMTEREHGSDATAMRTRLERGLPPTLHGAKRYVANASRAGVAVVFARTGTSPLGIRGVLLHVPAAGFAAAPLPMIGLRGACIGTMTLDGVPVADDAVLGAHLPASRRGLWGAVRAFNFMRTQLAAQAVGVGLAALDRVLESRPGLAAARPVAARLMAAQALVVEVAAGAQLRPDDRTGPSLAKLHATDLAVRVLGWASRMLGPGALAEDPLLEKWSRDVHAFEFMDGTTNILRLSVPTSHLQESP